MSVPVNERTEGHLSALTDAEELAARTIAITSDESVFPRRYRWNYTSRIVDAALGYLELLHEANSIYPRTRPEMDQRLGYLDRALCRMAGFLSLVSIVRLVNKISLDDRKVDNWVRLAYKARKSAMGLRSHNRKARLELPDPEKTGDR